MYLRTWYLEELLLSKIVQGLKTTKLALLASPYIALLYRVSYLSYVYVFSWGLGNGALSRAAGGTLLLDVKVKHAT